MFASTCLQVYVCKDIILICNYFSEILITHKAAFYLDFSHLPILNWNIFRASLSQFLAITPNFNYSSIFSPLTKYMTKSSMVCSRKSGRQCCVSRKRSWTLNPRLQKPWRNMKAGPQRRTGHLTTGYLAPQKDTVWLDIVCPSLASSSTRCTTLWFQRQKMAL